MTSRPPETESVSPRFVELDAWPDALALDALWESQMAAVAAVRPALGAIERAAEAAAARLSGGGRLAYAGAGTSGRIGVQDGAELPPTFDWPEDRLVLLMAGGRDAFTRSIEGAEDDTEAARTAIAQHDIGPADVVIGVAASGRTPFTLSCIEAAHVRGALTIAIANNASTPLLAAADHPILAHTGAEVLAGSTRLKAGTAQKVALNLLSTVIMLRLGRVYRGLMVEMRGSNNKLRQRAEQIVMQLGECDRSAARAALVEADGRIKLALLILRGLDREAAEKRLAEHRGRLRATLASLK